MSRASVIQGPSGHEPSQFLWATQSCLKDEESGRPSRAPRSRAERSLAMQKPMTWLSAFASSMCRPFLPMTTASSASQSIFFEAGCSATMALGAAIACIVLMKCQERSPSVCGSGRRGLVPLGRHLRRMVGIIGAGAIDRPRDFESGASSRAWAIGCGLGVRRRRRRDAPDWPPIAPSSVSISASSPRPVASATSAKLSPMMKAARGPVARLNWRQERMSCGRSSQSARLRSALARLFRASRSGQVSAVAPGRTPTGRTASLHDQHRPKARPPRRRKSRSSRLAARRPSSIPSASSPGSGRRVTSSPKATPAPTP